MANIIIQVIEPEIDLETSENIVGTIEIGVPGPQGPAGGGLPDGGTANQVLTKISSTDGDANWQDPTGSVDSVNGQTGVVVLDADDIDDTSTTNKFVTSSEKADIASAVQPGDLAGIATSGDYDDLSNKPDLSVFDEVEQYADLGSFPGTGDSAKIYVAQDSGLLYRWNGSAYTVVSGQLALGETSSTAYRGDRGKTAYDHSQLTSGNPHSVSKSDVGLGNVDNTSDADKPVSDATGTELKLKVDKQATQKRAGLINSASVLSTPYTDMVIGDSIGRGAGGTLGSTDFFTNLQNLENRDIGLRANGKGLVLAAEDEGIYGSAKFDTPGSATVGATGPSAGAGVAPATNLELTSSGMTISDTETFRRVTVFFEKQTSSPDIRVSTNGGSTWSSNIVTSGTDGTYGSWTSSDLGIVSSRTLSIKTMAAGNCRIIGARYHLGAGTSGIAVDNLSHGGTTTNDWLTYRGWETWATLTTPRRIYISLMGNDSINGVSKATYLANMQTIITRAQTASPLSEIVILGQYYMSKTGVKENIGTTLWEEWLTDLEALCKTNNCTFVNLYEALGDCSDGDDAFGLSMDGGLHLGDNTNSASGRNGQMAMALAVYRSIYFARYTPPYQNPVVETLTVQTGNASWGKLITDINIGAGAGAAYLKMFANTADTEGVATLGSLNGIGGIIAFGPGGSSAFDTYMIRTAAGVVAAGVGGAGTFRATTFEVGHATDTTISRVSAGKIAVEGVTVPTETSTNTLTNKTLTSPVLNTGVSGTAVDTDSTMAANSDTKLSSQKATKTALDAKRTLARVTFSDADYTITASKDTVVAQNGTMSATRTVTLPAASSVPAGTEIMIQDKSGTVSYLYNLIIARAGSDLINGATSERIVNPYGWRRLVSNGSDTWSFDGGILRVNTILPDNPVGEYRTAPMTSYVASLTLSSSTANSAGVIRNCPIIVRQRTTFDRAAIYIVTPATDSGALFDIGYAPSDANGVPDMTKVVSLGTLDATVAAGQYDLTINLTLPAGIWHMLFTLKTSTTAGTNPAIRGVGSYFGVNGTPDAYTNNYDRVWRATKSASGGLVDYTGISYTSGSSPQYPRVSLRVASYG